MRAWNAKKNKDRDSFSVTRYSVHSLKLTKNYLPLVLILQPQINLMTYLNVVNIKMSWPTLHLLFTSEIKIQQS